MKLNDWNRSEVARAESTWGHKTPDYTIDMFNFAIGGMDSWLDLGCGFGRFLEHLLKTIDEPDYIGYDSSQSMVDRLKERFPAFSPRIFHHDITSPITVRQNSIICSAVLIHITLDDQQKVLENVKEINPTKFTFDINCPDENFLTKKHHFERQIRGANGNFRMTWQSHYLMTKQILHLFPSHKLTTKFYSIHKVRHKAVYMLER